MDASWETSVWYERWCAPIIAALWERDKRKIRTRLAEAQCAIGQNHLFDEELLMLNTHLAYLEFQAYLLLKPEGWQENSVPSIISHLEERV